MDVSLDQQTTTTATTQRAATQLAANNVESGIGDSKSVAGHQAEQADSILSIEAMKYSANTIAKVTYQCEQLHWKVVGPRQVRCEAFQFESTGEEK